MLTGSGQTGSGETRPTAPPPARVNRVRRSALGPMLLFALFGAFYTLPPPGGDLPYHLTFIIEARRALEEGQFPIRVSPRPVEGRRYPTFQFYGNVPYTAPALLTFLPGVNAYEAWKLVTFLTVALAGFYTYLCALTLTRQTWPSVVAGAVFAAAPYLSTDVRARFAYTEAVSFCLLPVVLYYSLRAFVSPRLGAVAKGGVAWALVALSHNITYLYASTLICLFFLSLAGRDPAKFTRRMLRVGAGYALGLVLSLWYVVPQLAVLKYLGIAATGPAQSPLWTNIWAPLDVLLSPRLKVPQTPGASLYVGLQVGWTILAAAALSLVLVLAAFRRRGLRAGLQIRLLFALALAFFIVWSPVDFWRFVPPLFYNLQITYRILMFVVLWGSVLAGVALAAAWRPRGGMRWPAGAALVLVVGVAAMPHTVWGRSRIRSSWVSSLEARPDFGPAVSMYLPLPDRIAPWRLDLPPGVTVFPADLTRARSRIGKSTYFRAHLSERTIVQFPNLFYPGLNDVRDRGRPLAARHVGGLVALDLPPGDYRIRVGFVGTRWSNVISGAAWLAVAALAVVVFVRRRRERRLVASPTSAQESTPGSIPGSTLGSIPGSTPPAPAAFPARAALACFALLAVPMSLSAALERYHRYAILRSAGKLTASSESGGDHQVFYAFDGDPTTAWAAKGSTPAWLAAEHSPRRVSRVRLEARQTTLLEAWHTVKVVLYRAGTKVAEQTFSLPEASSKVVQEIRLDAPVEADRIELHFSDPVSVLIDGQKIDSKLCNPGYAEIRID